MFDIETYMRSRSKAEIIAATVSVVSIVSFTAYKLWMHRYLYNKYTQPTLQYQIHSLSVVNQSEGNKGKRTILITGGNGFLGRHIVQGLLQTNKANPADDKYSVSIIVLDISIPPKHLQISAVTYVQANLLNTEHLRQLFSSYSIDSVIHCASLIPFLGVPNEAIWKVNVTGTKNLLDVSLAFGVKSFIYTSSATSVLSKNDRNAYKLTEDTPYPTQNLDTYTSTKVAAEKLVVSSGDEKKMACCVLRPAAIFGKGDKLVSDNSVRGIDAFIIGQPTNKIDWVPVECVASAHILAESALQEESKRKIMNGNVYFIGNNEENTYGWFFGYDESATMSHWEQPTAKRLPIWLVDALATVNETMCAIIGVPVLAPSLCHSLTDYTRRSYTFSSDQAGRHFGYKPLMTVSEAIQRIVDDYKKSIKSAN